MQLTVEFVCECGLITPAVAEIFDNTNPQLPVAVQTDCAFCGTRLRVVLIAGEVLKPPLPRDGSWD